MGKGDKDKRKAWAVWTKNPDGVVYYSDVVYPTREKAVESTIEMPAYCRSKYDEEQARRWDKMLFSVVPVAIPGPGEWVAIEDKLKEKADEENGK